MQHTCPETGRPMRDKLWFSGSSNPHLSICLRNVKGEIWHAMLDMFMYASYAGQGSLEEHIWEDVYVFKRGLLDWLTQYCLSSPSMTVSHCREREPGSFSTHEAKRLSSSSSNLALRPGGLWESHWPSVHMGDAKKLALITAKDWSHSNGSNEREGIVPKMTMWYGLLSSGMMLQDAWQVPL